MFGSADNEALKAEVVNDMELAGLNHLGRKMIEPIFPLISDFCHFLLQASEDLEVHLGDSASGVRVGPGARLPRPAEAEVATATTDRCRGLLATVWRRNYSDARRALRPSHRCHGGPISQGASDCTC